MSTQSQCSPIPCPRHQPLTPEQMRAYLATSGRTSCRRPRKRRSDGLRRLYVELADGGDLWFDRLGHVARVDGRKGSRLVELVFCLGGMVELVFCLGFPEEWPGQNPQVIVVEADADVAFADMFVEQVQDLGDRLIRQELLLCLSLSHHAELVDAQVAQHGQLGLLNDGPRVLAPLLWRVVSDEDGGVEVDDQRSSFRRSTAELPG
jgi:hypothetical protein